MTVATYTSDLALITLFESTTGITDYGGGGGAASAGVDYAIEGTNAVDKQVNATERGFLFADAGGAWTIGADDHFYIWVVCGTYGLADTRDLRGICVAMGDDTSNFVQFHVNGGDTLPLGGMQPYAVRFVNTTLTNFRTLVGTPGTSPDSIGCTANITGTAKFANLAADACRFGTGYDILNGTGADPEADFAGIASDDLSTREGILVEAGGSFSLQGKLRIGSAVTACEFLDSNKSIVAVDTLHSLTDFTEILVEHASSILTLTNVTFKALGTNNPGRFEMLTDTTTLTMAGGGFIDWGVTILGSASTVAGASWVGSARIDLNEGDISGSNILTSTVVADEGAVFDDRTTTGAVSITELDNTTYSQGATAHHAIRFGVNVDDDITLTGINFNNFSSAADASGSTLRFDATTGTMNVNLIDCFVDGNPATTGNVGVDDAAGIVVTLVINPVTTKYTVQDDTGTVIDQARVLVETADNGGGSGFPYQAAVTTLTSSAGTATLTASAVHGLETGDFVVVRGAQPDDYNKQASITVTSTTVFEYSVLSGISSPATGTPVFSYAPISGLTATTGIIQSSKTWPAAQGLVGWARKSTAAPYFKQTAITVADASGGTDQTVTLQSDE